MLVCRAAMDNLTHTVIGCIAGAALARIRPTPARQRLLPAIGMIGGNLPDLDLLWSYRGRASDPGQLNYLLEHRGYTHTVLGCLLLAIALYAAAVRFARRRGAPLARGERALLLGGAVGAVLLHLAMDALNSYGVHPFWPFDDRWMYGDSVFIIEPLYWAAAAPLLFVFESRTARVLIGLLLIAGVGASAATGRLPVACLLVLGCLSVGGLLAGRVAGAGRAAALSFGAFIMISAAFVAAGQRARAQARQAAGHDFPGERLVDVVLSPLPADPLCWDVLVLSAGADRYQARRATVALAPGLIAAAACRDPDLHAPSTAHWHAGAGATLPWVTYSLPLADLRVLVRGHCQAAALMQFVRAPFIEPDGGAQILGDLRFDREAGAGLAKLRFPRPGVEVCPHAAPWTPPRADLLTAP